MDADAGLRSKGRTALRRGLLVLVSLSCALVVAEGLAWSIASLGWIDLPRPSHTNITFWGAHRDSLGVWHHPDSEALHRTDCFEVAYRANSIGARDRERAPNDGEGRVVVLGDSFVEGWGLPVEDRFTDLLEASTGHQHLNLGMAHFGPYQALLAYRKFGPQFDHDAVMLVLYPENDLVDLDYERALHTPTNDYGDRPFLVGAYPDYTTVAFRESSIRRTLRRRSWAFNAITLGLYRLRERIGSRWVPKTRDESGLFHSYYYDFSAEQFDLLRYTVERLLSDAGERPVAIVLIPAHRDFLRYHQSGSPPLVRELEERFSGPRVRVLDLLPPMYAADEAWDRYYLGCDPHLGPEGSRTVAAIIDRGLAGFLYPNPLPARPEAGSP